MSSKKAPKKLGELLRQAGEDASQSTRRSMPSHAESLVVKSISLTPSGMETLKELICDVSQRNQRKTNASAIVRALLRYVSMEPDACQRLAAIVESETTTGEVVWGKIKSGM